MMKKLILSIVAAMLTLAVSASVPGNLGAESLRYKVMYKWGVVHKQAGTANLSITPQGNQYLLKLTARTDPWADTWYQVRDTLTTVVNKSGFRPVKYQNVAHEGGDYKRDIVNFDYSGGSVIKAHCTHHKLKKKAKKPTDQKIELSAQGVALDMLSMYYYMRYLDYDKMSKGQKTKLYIFSGRRRELMTITFHGTETLSYDKKKYNCIHISFTFTSDGGKKTSDDMDAWISNDTRRIPIKLEGKLPVGKVHCLYVGG